MIKKIIDFLTNLVKTKPKRKERVILTKVFVIDIENRLEMGESKESIIERYNISDATYRRILKGEHKFSKQDIELNEE